MRKRKVLMMIGFCLFSMNNVSAQTDKFRKMYEDFKKEAKANYDDFRKKANARYAEFVERAWKQFHALPALPKRQDETVPPVVLADEDKNKPIESTPIPIKDVVTPPEPEPQPEPVSPIKEQPIVEESKVGFVYCGTECKVRFSDNDVFRLGGCDNETLAEAWTMLADGKYDNMIIDCLALREKMQLSDWAYLNMLVNMAGACLGESNEAVLLAAFAYCQSGYRMRIGRADDKLYLLFASTHSIFDKPYYDIDGEKFYPLNCDVDQMQICGASFPNEQSLSLYVPKRQLFAVDETQARTLTSERYSDMKFSVSVNKNLIDFYNTYPTSTVDDNFMTRWAMYANTPMEKEITERLYPVMKEKLKGLGQLDAVNKVLNWVQTAFVYEYDNKVWGGDRAFFSEESLYYPYCDCEDRSILFTRLVRDLLGLKCVLVYYPNHLASAVCFTENIEGDYITLDENRYTVCDPTYIGAPVGLTMPDMDNKTASIILLKE